MAQGLSTFKLVPGSGQQAPSASLLARSVVVLGCSPLLAPNAVVPLGNALSVTDDLDTGICAELCALLARPGQQLYALSVNPSVAGAVGDVTHALGIGTGVIKVSVAPHLLVEIQVYTAGALGTMQIKWRAGGIGSFSAPVTSGASGPWSFRVPGTYCVLAFAAGTYVLGSTYAIGTDGSITLGGSAINTVTFTASPIENYEFQCTVDRGGILGQGMLGLSLDNGNGSIPSQLLPDTGVIVVEGTGVVITCGQHVILITITTPGALGTAIYSIAIDGGSTVTGQATTPNSGGNYVVTVDGVTLTFAPGTYVSSSTYTVNADGSISRGGSAINTVTQSWVGFVEGDRYDFLTAGPDGSLSDYSAACDALRAVTTTRALMLLVAGMPSTLAGAYSLAATLQGEIDTAFTGGFDWIGMTPMPTSVSAAGLGDIVIVSSKAVRDTADTLSAIVAGRGSDTPRVSVFAGTERTQSAVSRSRFPLRPVTWMNASRFVDTDPRRDLAAVADGPLAIYVPPGQQSIIGLDGSVTPDLDAVQINTLCTYPAEIAPGAYLYITAGVAGWKNMTTQADYQRAAPFRVLCSAMPALRAVGVRFLAEDSDVKPDGTITETQARVWDSIVDGAFKRAVGLEDGGAFAEPQAAVANARISRASQLGIEPRELDIAYDFQSRGEVTQVGNTVRFSGVLTISL